MVAPSSETGLIGQLIQETSSSSATSHDAVVLRGEVAAISEEEALLQYQRDVAPITTAEVKSVAKPKVLEKKEAQK